MTDDNFLFHKTANELRAHPETLAVRVSREHYLYLADRIDRLDTEWECKAKPWVKSDPPQDCDWPFCGCDPHVEKVFKAIQESGKAIIDDTTLSRLKDIISRAIPSIGFHWSMTAGGVRKSNLLALRQEAEAAAARLEQGGI